MLLKYTWFSTMRMFRYIMKSRQNPTEMKNQTKKKYAIIHIKSGGKEHMHKPKNKHVNIMFVCKMMFGVYYLSVLSLSLSLFFLLLSFSLSLSACMCSVVSIEKLRFIREVQCSSIYLCTVTHVRYVQYTNRLRT